MDYSITAHPTFYNGVTFRSRLEARWAAFFDLVKWDWQYEPIDLYGWTPDFRVSFPCGHSECNSKHTLLVEVKPYFDLREFAGHPCTFYPFGFYYQDGVITDRRIPADASAAFGSDPTLTYWEMTHGAGGGIYMIEDWIEGDLMSLWKRAGDITQYKPERTNAK